MLSEEKIIKGCYSRYEREMLPEPKTVRIRFCKTGSLQFISHLDLQRTFHRILVRAGIPMWYTKGFNPHAKLVFGAPLSVGCESMCEMADLKIERKITFDEIKNQLNACLTDEMYVLDVYKPENKFNDIAFADYTITIKSALCNEETPAKISAIFSAPVVMTKKTKSGEKDVDIREFINALDAKFVDGVLIINTVLATGSTANLNPEYIVNALRSNLGILSLDDVDQSYTIMRNRFMTADMSLFV